MLLSEPLDTMTAVSTLVYRAKLEFSHLEMFVHDLAPPEVWMEEMHDGSRCFPGRAIGESGAGKKSGARARPDARSLFEQNLFNLDLVVLSVPALLPPLCGIYSAETGNDRDQLCSRRGRKTKDELGFEFHHAFLPEPAELEIIVELFFEFFEERVAVVVIVAVRLRLMRFRMNRGRGAADDRV